MCPSTEYTFVRNETFSDVHRTIVQFYWDVLIYALCLAVMTKQHCYVPQ